MNGNKNEIDELFSSSFEKFEIPSSEKDWELLSSKLSRANFWKFNFSGFNFYYVLLFAGFIALAAWLGITNLKQSKEINLLKDSIQIYNNLHEEILPSVNFPIDSTQDTQTIDEEIINKNEAPIPDNKIKEQANTTPTIENPKPLKDTSKVDAQPPVTPQDSTKKTNIKRVKKVMYVKPPAVITRDTVKLKKPID